jgi:putative ABC transport system permease protein
MEHRMATADRTLSSPSLRLPRPEARIPGRHQVQLLLLLAAATATVGLVLLVGGRGGGSAWQQTFEATNGPHVRVSGLPGVDLKPLMTLPGLTEASGPFPGIQTSLRHEGRAAGAWLEGRPATASVVDHPVIVSGRWLRPGAVVLDRQLAAAIGAGVGDRVTTDGASLRVAGITETATSGRDRNPAEGLGYVLPGTLATVVPDSHALGSTVMLRISDPDRSGSYVKAIESTYPAAQVMIEDWRRPRDNGSR